MAGDYNLDVGLPEDEERRQRYLDMLAERGEIGHDSGLTAKEPPREDAKTVGEAPVGSLKTTTAQVAGGDAPPVRAQVPDLLNGPQHDLRARRMALSGGNQNAPPVRPGPPVSFPTGPRPEWKDYAPPVKHGMGRFGEVLGEMFTGTPQRSQERAQQNYRNDTRDYDTQFSQAESLQPKPKEEKWTVVPGMKGPKGQLVQEEQNSGQIRYAPDIEGMQSVKEAPAGTPAEQTFRQHMTGGPNGGPEVNPATQKPYTVDEALEATQRAPKEDDKSKDIKDVLAAKKWPDDAEHREMARDVIAKRAPTAHVEVAGPGGEWQMAEDDAGKTVLYNAKTGETKAAPANVHPKGAHAAREKAEGPEQAIQYAKDYHDKGVFTGPGDEALMEKFFELAKPSSGFRMTQQQMDMLRNARSWMGSFEAHMRHATMGTWFSDDQRKEITDTMTMLEGARKPKEEAGGDKATNKYSDLGAVPVKK